MVRRARGFTIIEVLVVMALSFVGLLGLLSIQVVALRAAGLSRSMTEAVALGQDKLESLNHVPIALLAASVEANIGPQGAAGGVYRRQVTVTPVAAGTTIRVQVSWSDVANRAHAVNLYTLRSP